MARKNLNSREIKEILLYLKTRLPDVPTAVNGIYVSPKKILDELKDKHYPDSAIQQMSDHIGYFLGILNSIKVKYIQETNDGVWISIDGEIVGDIKNLDKAGLYQARGSDHSEILLFKKNRYKVKHLLAILAHEYSHHYLFLKNIRLGKELDNEVLTDIAAVYLGLGGLLYRGYKPISWESDRISYGSRIQYTKNRIELGYINQPTIKRAILITAEQRNWGPKEVALIFSDFLEKISIFLFLNCKRYLKTLNKKKLKEKKKRQGSNCPFCKRFVLKVESICPYCKRTVREKIN